MYYVCKLEVKIGGKLLETVTEIEVSNDAAQIGSNCDIVVPLTVRIQNKGQYLIDNVRNLFKSGDTVAIYAWYEDMERQLIFEGFVYDFLEGTPIKIRCLDYVYKLRQGIKNLSYKKAQIKNVIKDIIAGSGLTLMKPYIDFEVTNLTFPNMSPAACLEWIKKEMALVCTIIGKEIYFNIASNTLNTVRLKSDVNVIGVNMQKPDAAFQKFKVKAWIKKENGTKEAIEIGDADGELREIKLLTVSDKKGAHTKILDNALEQIKIGHYNGKIVTLLYPYCDLFWAVDYEDVRYPERSAIYTIRALNITISQEGFHRELTVAFLRHRS